MTTDTLRPHVGRNLKRIREMKGIKQEALASELGKDWTQKKVSALEQRETIETEILDEIAKYLGVTPEAIQNFNEEAATTFFNTFHDQSGFGGYNYQCNFNPLDKVVELYERLLASEKEKVELLKNKDK